MLTCMTQIPLRNQHHRYGERSVSIFLRRSRQHFRMDFDATSVSYALASLRLAESHDHQDHAFPSALPHIPLREIRAGPIDV